MARIRSIKPEFFLHEGLADLSPLHRLLFIGLWTQADREGRLKDKPRRIKAAVLPYDDGDVDQMLADLERLGVIARYSVGGEDYIAIPSFLDHQKPHLREAPSEIPVIPAMYAKAVPEHNLGSAQPRKGDAEPGGSGKGREGKGKEGDTSPLPPADAGEPLGVFPVPADAEEQDATGPMLQLAALQAAEKPKRSKERKPCPEVEVVRAEVMHLVGIDYPPAAWDGLRALIVKGTSGEDALTYVRWCSTQQWERETVRLDPTVLFRHARFAAGLAKATAARAATTAAFAAPIDPERTDYSKGWT